MTTLIGGATYSDGTDSGGGYWTDTPPASSSNLGAIQTPSNPYMFTLAGVQNAAGTPGASYNGIPASQVYAAMQNGATADQAMTPYQPTLYGSATQTGGGTTVVSTPPVTQQATQNNVQVKNNTVNPNWVTPSQALAPQQMIQIGGRSYPASSVIAQAAPIAGPSFGGSFQAMQPVMDTNGSASPPVYNLGSQGGQTQLAAPDISGYMPSPYENGLPQAPQNNPYMPSPAMMAAYGATGAPMPMAPQGYMGGGAPVQFAPGGSPYGNPLAQNPNLGLGVAPNPMAGPQLYGNDATGRPFLHQPRQPQPGAANTFGNFIHKLYNATPQGEAKEAARYKFDVDHWAKVAQMDNTLKQTLLPAMLNYDLAMRKEQNENYRNAANNYAHAAEAVLSSMLRTREAQTMNMEQALKSVAEAMMMPSTVVDPRSGQVVPNQYKYMALNQAAPLFGWSPQHVGAMAMQQDPKAAEVYQQAALETRAKQFALYSATRKLNDEVRLLKAQASQANASANNLNAQARSGNFQTDQNMQVAKFERAVKVAQAMDAVSNHLVNAATRDSRINEENGKAVKAQAEALAAQYTAIGLPVKYATEMAKAKAALLATLAPEAKPLAAVLDDAVLTALGIKSRQVAVPDPNGPQGVTKMQGIPVQAPPAMQYFGNPRNAFKGTPGGPIYGGGVLPSIGQMPSYSPMIGQPVGVGGLSTSPGKR